MNRYVEAAVDSEIQALRRTSSGRACATFKAAAAIGGFVGAGEVDRSVAERALLSAYTAERPVSAAELAALPVLAQGAAIRFLLTRLYD